jgi:putative sterol carrier protein
MIQGSMSTLLERLSAPILPPKLKSASVRYRFRLDGKEQWDVVLDQGRLTLEEMKSQPDCLVECSPEEFTAIFSGRHNMLTVFMRGNIRFQGTIQAAKLLHTFIRYAQLEETKA